jgi:prepilin-type N-terminal cleavage/methylation domain-containing protein
MTFSGNKSAGFTLVEMAVVLLILGLLLAGLLMPLSAQMDTRKEEDTRKLLEQAKDALIGYALANSGRLPRCASTTAGTVDPACAGEGYLPWQALGLAQTDAWGRPFRYRADATFVAAYTLATANSATGLTVNDSVSGAALTEANPNAPVALIFSCGKDGTPSGANSAGGAANCNNTGAPDAIYTGGSATSTFDDQLVWIPRYTLINRVVAAGVVAP